MLNKLVGLIKERYSLHKSFCRYLMISVFVTILDTGVSRVSEIFVTIMIANSIGIIAGFTVQFFLTSKHVYYNRDLATFVKFLLTFLFGFVLANSIVYVCRILIFHGSEEFIAFIVSKGFSIVIPFFAMYFLRKHWIKTKTNEQIKSLGS